MTEVVIIYKQGHTVPKNVTKLIFDSSVIEVPKNAFFKGREHLKEVVLNEGLVKIGPFAFYECTKLRIIKLPSTITEVGMGAFYECTNLSEVVLNAGLQEIGYSAFEICTSLAIIKVPSTVTEIGACAFNGCTNLSVVVLDEGLQKIGNNAFADCTSLTIIKLPSTVTQIGESAFDCCTNLREVIFDEGLPTVKETAFAYCTSLAVVKFPNISKRISNLIDAGQTNIEDKVTVNQHFEWRGGELLVSPEAIRSDNLTLAATRTNLEQVLAWITRCELKEATTLYELLLWKANIVKMGAVTKGERSGCRVDVPGPAKDAILQYLQPSDATDDN